MWIRRNAGVALALLLFVAPAALAAPPDGRALYESKCALCHGKDGVAKPIAKGSANLNDSAWQAANPTERIVKVIREGKGIMPKYGDKLVPEEIEAIAAHVKTLGAKP